MYYVYILELKNGEFYTGYTKDLRKRLQRHNNGTTVTTMSRPPKELVFYAALKTKKKALAFEEYLKSSSGFAFRNKRLV
jgi:putative endonuclease